MCGIFGIINYDGKYNTLQNNFIKGAKRGPEFSSLKKYNNIYLGFHRLAIVGLNEKSNQPIEIDNIVIVCNGEIYNYKELAKEHFIQLTTDSDCEIILHMYRLYGIEYTLLILDGVFSFILYDKNLEKMFVSRDPYGIRPLYSFYENNNIIGFASELKTIYNLCIQKKNIQYFFPGTYIVINNHLDKNNNYNNYNNAITYYYKHYSSFPVNNNLYNNETQKQIVLYMNNAVKKRVVGTCERPIACLLSGGLDSSLVAALVSKYYSSDKKLKTFSIGLPGSEDLKYASIVAKHIGSDHHEIIVSEDDFFNAIPEVIQSIESYDTTTVRASVGNYLIGKYIKENSDCKVVFNGDGADELMGGYLYMKKAPNAYEFDKECKLLLHDIHMFDVLRSDKCISSHGLEPRTPFLDKKWVEFYLTIDRNVRFNTTKNNCEKYLIRSSFSTYEKDLLPKEILWRTKEAFSDGVSSLNKSWYEIIQEKLENLYLQDNSTYKLESILINLMKTYENLPISNNIPKTFEQAYYRYIYNKHYRGTDALIDYYWMPKYVDAKDASARTLNVYNENNNNKQEIEPSE